MTVYCMQLVDGEQIDDEYVIQPLYEGQTDTELLTLKFDSASNKDWDVEWIDETSFVARKVRWQQEALCERVFRIEG